MHTHTRADIDTMTSHEILQIHKINGKIWFRYQFNKQNPNIPVFMICYFHEIFVRFSLDLYICTMTSKARRHKYTAQMKNEQQQKALTTRNARILLCNQALLSDFAYETY